VVKKQQEEEGSRCTLREGTLRFMTLLFYRFVR
jgi:hypothetical protein